LNEIWRAFILCQKGFFDIRDNNFLPSGARKWGAGKKILNGVRGPRCNSFEKSQEDLFHDNLCDPPPKGYEDEGGSKILKNVRHSLTHAAICVRVHSRPAAYLSPIGGRLDSVSRWREYRVCSISQSLFEWEDVCLVGTRKRPFLAGHILTSFRIISEVPLQLQKWDSSRTPSGQSQVASVHVTSSRRHRVNARYYAV